MRATQGGGRVGISLRVFARSRHYGHVIGASKVARHVPAVKRGERVLAEPHWRSEAALQAGEVGT
ncbi:hypothetical protein [Fimbriiglobus ruber]|uniref:hypothetical protein n=1 Tax=Fimbriiglobus ruber TaxID=1908690 RepID=UPI000B4B82AE|nr:hypothetical protein [Fimbriiglobus ruber]